MKKHKDFIGMGPNPNPGVPDIPLGLGSALSRSPEAKQSFANLSDEQKTRLIGFIQANNTTGTQAKQKIHSAVENLKNGNTSFF